MNIRYELSKEELRQVQKKSLDMAIYFRDFCIKNNLKFFLCGGCCIGAIRHKGFIPWDDDVDVFMPRDDYEKLREIWDKKANTKRFSYCREDEHHHYRNLFATINHNDTTFIKNHQADLDINHGLVLDVLPLDGCPNSKIARGYQIFWAIVYSIFCAQISPTNHGKLANLVGDLILKFVPSNKIRFKIWKFAEKKMTKFKIKDCNYITELCSGPFYMKKKYPKSVFDDAMYVSFEGEQMPIPVGYDEYLRIAFGDYMKMPPKEKQVAHHDVVFCDVLNCYKKYRGVYYCRGEDK